MRLYRTLVALSSEEQRDRLRQVLVVPDGSRRPPFDRAQAIQRMSAERGMAALMAFACTLQASAQDDVLDVLDRLLTRPVGEGGPTRAAPATAQHG
jgi:hypothetical protein